MPRLRSNSIANPGAAATYCSGVAATTVGTATGNATAPTSAFSAQVPVVTGAQKPQEWHTPITGSSWIIPTATANVNAPDFNFYHYQVSFTVDAGFTGQVNTGSSYADNQVTQILVDNTGGSLGANADLNDAGNYMTNLLAWSNSGTLAAGPHTLDIYVHNNDRQQPTNPTGVDFCFTVTQTIIPVRPVALFVIGDKEAHAIGDVVNFWGAQWWKNNDMTGTVDNGYNSFKGYAVTSTNVCGGTWTSLPGNSSNPPDVIGADIAIIVTSKVLKNGNDISGDIKQIVIVHQDGGYGPNPGHDGNGTVTSVVCHQ